MNVTPPWHDLCMVANTARRVREGLAELIRLVNDPAVAAGDLRAVLVECKVFGGQLAVLQADAAAGLAVRERHGDSGVGVLAQAVGLSRREAAGQVKVAKRLESLPLVRDAVETGQVSVANARVLAGACEKTSAEQVEQDSELLAQAAVLSPEQFAQEAGRWAARRRADDGEELYRRQRARRRLSIWDGDDGMVHLRGELDPVTGAKVRKRFMSEAERLRRQDLHGAGSDKRSFNQRMADAFDTLTSHGSIYSKSEGAGSGGNSRGEPVAGSNGGGETRSGNGVSESSSTRGGVGGIGEASADSDVGTRGASGEASADSDVGARGASGDADTERTGGRTGKRKGGGRVTKSKASGRCGCGGRASADITIVQHLSADGTGAFAEIGGGGVIPQSVLEEHFCNAAIKGVVFSHKGVPLWHGHTKRLATKAQMNALRARYGACGGCGADMWVCQGHHIKPVSEGGRTDIGNMMLVCWSCHQKVHHHGWRVVPDGRGLYTIAPPERIRHGPAHAPDPPPAPGPFRSRAPARPVPLPHA